VPSTTEIEAILKEAGAVLSPSQWEALREAVCRFADEARAEGMRPEKVIVAIRSAMKAAGDKAPDDVIHSVIDWCLRRYFESDD
jgi:hypothetical protein